MNRLQKWLAVASTVALTSVVSSHDANAFCGFYVAPQDGPLFNDATQVALMREGTRTVISMSNNYKGPASDFAMIVPVPVVLKKENVKTLPKDVFSHLETLSAPRLVEYWEQDPCHPYQYDMTPMPSSAVMGPMPAEEKASDRSYGVKIEAKFSVGEYDILVLSAEQSDGLERWLIDNHYKIPKGAGDALAPYIREQQKFFVAKINIKKVAMDAQGVAILSPLRFNYETPDFRLPVRLGLLNANGKQDLIVYVLANDKRYEVANYPTVFVPTNLDVSDDTRKSFGAFYSTLFDATLVKAGGRAVVTEYSWQSSSCDPCPTPPLDDNDVATLGGDVLFGMAAPPPTGGAPSGVSGSPMGGYYGGGSNVVLTRLHTRYDKATLTEDLVFKAATPVVGGREFVTGDKGQLEKGARPDSQNNFQARYVIRHRWTGAIACENPQRGIWGGPPGGGEQSPTAAMGLASAPRGTVSLSTSIKSGLDDVESWDRAAKSADTGGAVPTVGPRPACGCQVPRREEGMGMAIAAGVGLLAIIGARRSRKS
ncbi:MAG: DUF2330 domain-containing protein [Polyangiales bacterium]